jgi:hypothetical protein
MATTVGTESTLGDLLDDLIELDYDAADAYQAAIDRLDDPAFRSTLAQFKGDHLRHIDELGTVLMGMGRTPPKQGSFKSILARGKVVIGGLAGDKARRSSKRCARTRPIPTPLMNAPSDSAIFPSTPVMLWIAGSRMSGAIANGSSKR